MTKIFLGLLVILSCFLGYKLYALNEAHKAQTAELEKTTHRAKLLQKKYTAQKAQTAALQRAKLTVEGLKRKAEMEAEKLMEELEALKASKSEVNEDVKLLEARIMELETNLEAWEKKYNGMSAKYRGAKKTIAKRDSTISSMKGTIGELQAELEYSRRTQQRYLSNNQEMAAISQSILARYDEKSVIAKDIIKAEPFTQIKKVELEKLIQAYLDQIDEKVIRE
jgi:chromosome segregation ATPase